jgi:hypothetical protein
VLPLLVGGMVSGSISLPSRGAFRLSLTVLVHYRWQRVFSLRRWFSQIPAKSHVFRGTWVLSKRSVPFDYGAFTLCGRVFQTRSSRNRFCNSSDLLPLARTVPQHPTRNAGRLSSRIRFRLIRFRSPLLTESLLFSLPSDT